MRSNVEPSSNDRDRKNGQPFVFNSFSRGTVKDPPAGKINDCLADSLNLNIFPGYYEGRTGCRLYTSTKPPAIEGTTGISAHKVGTHIISDSGNIFTQLHVGAFFCFGDRYELITEYVSATEVVGSNSIYRETFNGHMIGSPNIFDYHTSLRQWYLLIGREFYTADIPISSWKKILTISRDQPFSSNSGYSEYKNKLVAFNGNGMYKVDLGATYPIAYRVNIDPPNIRIISVPYDVDLFHKHRYRYLYSAMRIANDGGIVNRQSPSVIDLETGTNVADAEDIDYSEIWTEYEIDKTWPKLIQTLWVPIVKNTNPQEYQWHLSHFPIYRTPDLEAIDPMDPDKSKYNDPSRLIWVKDLRICAAFYGYIQNDRLYLERGEFETADTGSVIETDGGERFELETIVSPTEAIIDEGYYGLSVPLCAMAIGNGRVIRGSVTGDIFTRTAGSKLTASDDRKTMYNSEGYRFYITEYLDANRVRLHISGDQLIQGFTMDPTHREFYDTTRDEVLHARKDFYSCATRYREALPSGNIGTIFPEFLVTMFRGQKEVYYSHLQDKMDYLIGQHVKIQVSDKIQGSIMQVYRFQDVVSFFCSSSTWGVQVGLSEFATLPGSNEAIAMLPGIKQTVESVGCVDYGSIKAIDGGMVALITNEQGGEAGRYFNGYSYNEENWLVDTSFGGRIVKAFQKTKKLSQAIYDGIMGYILWRRNA